MQLWFPHNSSVILQSPFNYQNNTMADNWMLTCTFNRWIIKQVITRVCNAYLFKKLNQIYFIHCYLSLNQNNVGLYWLSTTEKGSPGTKKNTTA